MAQDGRKSQDLGGDVSNGCIERITKSSAENDGETVSRQNVAKPLKQPLEYVIAKAASCVEPFSSVRLPPASRKKVADLKHSCNSPNDSAAVSRQNVAKPHPIPCDNLLTFARVGVAGGKTAR
jgi:hypothetical protein